MPRRFAPAECVLIAPSLRVFPSDFAPAECVLIAPSLRVFVLKGCVFFSGGITIW